MKSRTKKETRQRDFPIIFIPLAHFSAHTNQYLKIYFQNYNSLYNPLDSILLNEYNKIYTSNTAPSDRLTRRQVNFFP